MPNAIMNKPIITPAHPLDCACQAVPVPPRYGKPTTVSKPRRNVIPPMIFKNAMYFLKLIDFSN